MKEELPDNYKNKNEEVKVEAGVSGGHGEAGVSGGNGEAGGESSESKPKVPEEKPGTGESGSPSEGNVATAAAAALASAAVKAKVSPVWR